MSASLELNLQRCRRAFRDLRVLSSVQKNAVLLQVAALLGGSMTELLKANALDLAELSGDKTNAAFRDRLLLNEERVGHMIESLKQVAGLSDPVGEVAESKTLANGLLLERVRSPLGVLFMIFESRPNVITEAFSLAFKAGNAIILRGGKETKNSARVLYGIIQKALENESVDSHCIWGITDPNREITANLLNQTAWIDVVIPRGGDSLIQYVMENSKIPIIKNDRGMCHVYVHEDAQLGMATEIVKNAKAQRPGVCNSMETLLVHRKIARALLPQVHAALSTAKVHWYGCAETIEILTGFKDVSSATEKSWDTEYLDFKMNCKIVEDATEAFAHIERHGSRHSETIVTKSPELGRKFQENVDAAAVYWNASTRFTDGFEFGLGGELGISTQKIHVRGPVGLRELTSLRWIGTGTGQVRK